MWRTGGGPAASAAEVSGAGGAENKSSLDMPAIYQFPGKAPKAK
jgi:hypothetical protein